MKEKACDASWRAFSLSIIIITRMYCYYKLEEVSSNCTPLLCSFVVDLIFGRVDLVADCDLARARSRV